MVLSKSQVLVTTFAGAPNNDDVGHSSEHWKTKLMNQMLQLKEDIQKGAANGLSQRSFNKIKLDVPTLKSSRGTITLKKKMKE